MADHAKIGRGSVRWRQVVRWDCGPGMVFLWIFFHWVLFTHPGIPSDGRRRRTRGVTQRVKHAAPTLFYGKRTDIANATTRSIF